MVKFMLRVYFMDGFHLLLLGLQKPKQQKWLYAVIVNIVGKYKKDSLLDNNKEYLIIV